MLVLITAQKNMENIWTIGQNTATYKLRGTLGLKRVRLLENMSQAFQDPLFKPGRMNSKV